MKMLIEKTLFYLNKHCIDCQYYGMLIYYDVRSDIMQDKQQSVILKNHAELLGGFFRSISGQSLT